MIGAGLAGVASKREQEGIKIYNDRTKYNEWEFVYDISKDPTKNPNANMAAGAAGASGGQGKSGSGSSNTSSPSPFGQSGTGQSPATPPPSTTGTTPSQ